MNGAIRKPLHPVFFRIISWVIISVISIHVCEILLAALF